MTINISRNLKRIIDSAMKRESFYLLNIFYHLLFMLSATILLLPCYSLGQSPPKLKCVTTLFPLQEFARAVGGDHSQTDLLLPPGAEPHSWEPKPSDLGKIYQADIFIFTDPAMEPWVNDILAAAKNNRLKIIQASKGLHLLGVGNDELGERSSASHAESGKMDPHIWLDFSLDQKILEAIAAAFSEKDPAHASKYRANAAAYIKKLDAVDQKYRKSLSRCRHRQFILGGHSAFSYLAQRYGLQQTALYGLSPNAEPIPKKLATVVQAIKNQGVRYIYFEELVNPKLAQVLAKETGVSTLVLNDGANLTKDQLKNGVTFLELMEMNLENLRRGLECDRS